MFTADLSETKIWKNSVKAIASLIDEGTLNIGEEGFRLRAMDPSQIALVDFSLPQEAFENYELEEEANIGIDFSELSKINKRCRKDDKIQLSLDDRLNLIFQGKTKRSFALAIIEENTNPPKKPDVDFTANVKIEAGMLTDALKDAELVSNHIAISAEENQLSITAEGDTGSVDIDFPEENIMDMEVDEKARSVFSLDQLNNLLNAAQRNNIVDLKLKTDSPLRVEYSIGDGEVVYFLAPRIEST